MTKKIHGNFEQLTVERIKYCLEKRLGYKKEKNKYEAGLQCSGRSAMPWIDKYFWVIGYAIE